jgi:hypothetical protein
VLLPGTIGSTEFSDFNEHPAAQVWRAACEALASDPDAQLPM